jgi:hypothetical protein
MGFEAVLFVLFSVCVLYPVCTKVIDDIFDIKTMQGRHSPIHIPRFMNNAFSRIHTVRVVSAQAVVGASSWLRCAVVNLTLKPRTLLVSIPL